MSFGTGMAYLPTDVHTFSIKDQPTVGKFTIYGSGKIIAIKAPFGHPEMKKISRESRPKSARNNAGLVFRKYSKLPHIRDGSLPTIYKWNYTLR